MAAHSSRLRAIAEQSRDRIAAIWKAPLIDPLAPAGYVYRGFADTDIEIRLEQSRTVMAETIETIRGEFGDDYADAAERHFARLDALMP